MNLYMVRAITDIKDDFKIEDYCRPLVVRIGAISLNQVFILRMISFILSGSYIFTVLVSYDYGAPIREDRTLSPKYSEIKLQSLFLHASPSFLVATRFGNGTVGSGTAFSNNTAIYTTALSVSGTGAINSQAGGGNFYVVRHTDNS